MLRDVVNWTSIVAAFVAVGWFMKFIASGAKERTDEDRARTYFDRHGHWPDEKPDER